LIIQSSFVLAVTSALPSVHAAELKSDGPRTQLPATFREARLGDDPDSIPQARSNVDGSGFINESVHIWNPMVACTVREIGDDPDPIPRIWWVACRNIGDDPDSIPPTN
jgi:hypothetical protein